MAYAPTTRLARKTPNDAPEDEDQVDLSVYNEIEIIGQSPVQRGIRTEEWTGQQGDLLTIKPLTGHGEVIDVAQGQLERDYDVTYIPERVQRQVEVTRYREDSPTPLEKLGEQAERSSLEPASIAADAS